MARRFGTVATFYKYAVIDGTIPANPAAAVTRPKVSWEGQKRTVLHPLEFAALLAAARTSGPNDRALVSLLGMLGLRVSEACATDITHLRYEAGYELLHVLGKGAKPADIPLPIPVLRAVRDAIERRATGPILRTRTGRRMDRAGASRALTRVAHAAGITRPISPHGLRRTICTTGLVAGIGIRDLQYAMRHADPRTTSRLWTSQLPLVTSGHSTSCGAGARDRTCRPGDDVEGTIRVGQMVAVAPSSALTPVRHRSCRRQRVRRRT